MTDHEELPHVDPEFYEKFHFCRQPCTECQRLDDIEIAEGTTVSEAWGNAIANVVAALRGGADEFDGESPAPEKATNSGAGEPDEQRRPDAEESR